VDQPVHEFLAAWESYYIIVGSVAGALIGLQFVVIALIADSERPTSAPEVAAFGTPTVLHFCAALLLSALLSAPWTSLPGFRFALAAAGAAGVTYALIVVRRARRPHQYRPEPEDWVWYVLLPLALYLMLLVAAALVPARIRLALSLVATVALGLVFIGIRNAWDTVIFIATGAERGAEAARREREGRPERGGRRGRRRS
jgi:hypothetical protein